MMQMMQREANSQAFGTLGEGGWRPEISRNTGGKPATAARRFPRKPEMKRSMPSGETVSPTTSRMPAGCRNWM